jgi:hypothetical protein
VPAGHRALVSGQGGFELRCEPGPGCSRSGVLVSWDPGWARGLLLQLAEFGDVAGADVAEGVAVAPSSPRAAAVSALGSRPVPGSGPNGGGGSPGVEGFGVAEPVGPVRTGVPRTMARSAQSVPTVRRARRRRARGRRGRGGTGRSQLFGQVVRVDPGDVERGGGTGSLSSPAQTSWAERTAPAGAAGLAWATERVRR